MEDFAEPERSYPSSNMGRVLKINVPLLILIIGLILVAQQQSFYAGLGQLLAAVGLMGLGALLNLIAALTTKGNRTGYLVAGALHGALFFLFMHGLSQFSFKPPGG